jgi:hypothetical protein
MSVPLDRLYHYIESVASKVYGDVVIYRFWPHGSKNINDLNNLNAEDTLVKKATCPLVWCNDQEPLNYEYYSKHLRQVAYPEEIATIKTFKTLVAIKNLNYQKNIFKKHLLLHSEKRSHELENYAADNELIPVYYWSHAVIAQDWFRYAQHEIFNKNTKKTFLIYNRAWSGTREYRLRFADLLIENNLLEQCQTTFNAVDPGSNKHYTTHNFKNISWRPKNHLENFFKSNNSSADSSADFVTKDYKSTDIEVVLETLFDDNRLHLTEKILRPIACGQPFILAGTHSSLEYLRGYGFKTFDAVWNENYDQITNPEERLQSMVDVMIQIANWDPHTRQQKMAQANAIADYNKKWFFSKDFFNLIIGELETNFKLAFEELELCNNYKHWIDCWDKLLQNFKGDEFLSNGHPISDIHQIMKIALEKLKNSNQAPGGAINTPVDITI